MRATFAAVGFADHIPRLNSLLYLCGVNNPTALLIGYSYEPVNVIERAVSSNLGIDLPELTRGFEVAEMPELASKGGYRAVAVDVDPVFDGSADDAGVGVTAGLFLPKGCYATVLLREYMKE